MQVLEVEGVIAGIGSLARRSDGRLWVNVEVIDEARFKIHGIRAVRAMARVLSTLDEPVYAGCWQDRYETAPKLLQTLGFQPTLKNEPNGNRLWVREWPR